MNKMKSIILMQAVVLFIILMAVTPLLAQEPENTTWSQSYESYRTDIKPMPEKEKIKCEQRLHEILNDLDTRNNCDTDEECTLLDQKPFGNTVPMLKKDAEQTKSKMKKYNETCVDPSKHFVPNKDLVHLPVCWKNRCMVKTSLKK
jgi:hypothetical protein